MRVRGAVSLPSLALPIKAQPALVFQLIAAVGQGPDAAHARVIERPSANRAIVEFTTRVAGRTVKTLEEVGFHTPDRITYRLLKGPLPAVDEEFRMEPDGDNTILRYRATFVPHAPWWRAAFDRAIVPWIYRKAVTSSMHQIKQAAEERQRKSRVFGERKSPEIL
ncbi:MAG: SRPBCC family protein [Candidatus Dormibacteraeota bacterium]|nr:SRPBCC family protein [Candidatus Dormibacteraeota bacterium]